MKTLIAFCLALTLSACSGSLNHTSGVVKGLVDLVPTIYTEGEDTVKSIYEKIKGLF